MKLFGTGALYSAFGRASVLIFTFFIAGCATAPAIPAPTENFSREAAVQPVTAPLIASPTDRAPAVSSVQGTVASADNASEPIEIFSPGPAPVASPEESDRDPATAAGAGEVAKQIEEAPQRKVSTAAHGRGDNWFLRDLPVVRIQFLEDGGAVEGVHYRKVVLHRCPKLADAVGSAPVDPELAAVAATPADPGLAAVAATPADEPKTEFAGAVTTAYYSGRNLEAIEVQLHGHTLSCSTGAIDINPEVALALLLKSSPTALMYPSIPGRVTAFSRTAFNQSVESSFEVASDVVEGEGETDEIFVPTAIDPSDRVYVAAKGAGGNWRLILPVAGDIPLKTLSEKLALVPEQADMTVLDLLASSSAEETTELPELMAKTWSMFEHTSDDLDLRDSFYSTYRIPLRIGDEHTTAELSKLTHKFTYRFASSDSSTSEVFHTVGERKEFVLSRSGPMWRAVANLVHQAVHAVQEPGAVDSADLTFRNEMEAQLKQEAYLTRISARNEGLRMMIENYNAIAAVAARRVRWADSETPPSANSLCDNVIDSYAIDRAQIAPSTLKEYSCPGALPAH